MAKIPFEVGNPKRVLRQRRWLIGLLAFLLAYLLVINSFTNLVDTDIKRQASTSSLVRNAFVINTKGCQIPDLSPFEPSAMRYFDKVKPIVCEQGTHLPLIDSNSSAIFVNIEARDHYYNESESVDCCWRSFWRSRNEDSRVTLSRDCHPFNESAWINDEFVQVQCQNHNESVYEDYFAFVPRKLRVENRVRALEHKSQQQNHQHAKNKTPRKLSILVIGVDSVSRLNLHRTMPETANLLRELGAVELMGYNKVADNTYPNIVPLLSGLPVSEFEKLCWRNRKKPFDDCPFVWRKAARSGYRTIFGEDACSMTIFNYLKPGFRKEPTDYYLRPFCVAAEATIGNTHRLNANLCLGTRLNFETLLRYTYRVAEEFADDPYFALFWQASLTHDFVEYSSLGDGSYRDLLAELTGDRQLLRNTALIFMSDHGMRWGSFRQTYQGRLEDSLPFAFLLMPDWWLSEHPRAVSNLKTNARRLTTPFDLHETIVDLLDSERLAQYEVTSASIPASMTTLPSIPHHIPVTNRSSLISPGLSLLTTLISEDRTCWSAGIPEHWCMCHGRRNVSRNDPALPILQAHLLQELNRQLNQSSYGRSRCKKLKLDRLIEATLRGPEVSDKDKPLSNWSEYTLTVQTKPGGALIEASMRYSRHPLDNNNRSNSFHSGNKKVVELVGPVSRLNAYGKQSACVPDFHLRLFCYCVREMSVEDDEEMTDVGIGTESVGRSLQYGKKGVETITAATSDNSDEIATGIA
ncbi:hypothetical protein QAD02_015587 [Eretmocerus hayati]|uniref:Uncharacterized protein n=1 Tax=Eretmocerus hayati TaxID=131215 RepID=A0ACC2PDF6_9HYME|nr:hypothetical protein QAD02_015587 [Eretmocerus hayati]